MLCLQTVILRKYRYKCTVKLISPCTSNRTNIENEKKKSIKFYGRQIEIRAESEPENIIFCIILDHRFKHPFCIEIYSREESLRDACLYYNLQENGSQSSKQQKINQEIFKKSEIKKRKHVKRTGGKSVTNLTFSQAHTQKILS